ncbi:hypothetical protein [Streptomyces sp. NPDC002619]|uniref:hypothetical protein n=1 Tax=Streptomyces sp. NPDC002619 TaxID=3364655 RepID=UPI00369ACA63
MPESEGPVTPTRSGGPFGLSGNGTHSWEFSPAQLSENIKVFVASFDERRRAKPRRVSAQAPYRPLDNSVADSAYIRAVAAGIEKGQAEKREQARLRERAKQANPVAKALVMVCGGVSVERRRLSVSGAGAAIWSLTLTGGAHSLLA